MRTEKITVPAAERREGEWDMETRMPEDCSAGRYIGARFTVESV